MWRLIHKHEKEVFLKVVAQMKQFPLVHWRTHDVLRVFTDATCDYITSPSVTRCGQTAPHISWISAPLQRLCVECYQKSENEDFFLLTKLLKHYKLKDATGIPTYTGMMPLFCSHLIFKLGTAAMDGGQVLSWAAANKWSELPKPNMVQDAHHPLDLRQSPFILAVWLRRSCIEAFF
jgi:hypothetical protein